MSSDLPPARSRPLWLLTAVTAALAAAVTSGTWVGWAVYRSLHGPAPSTGFDELGHAFVALLAGLAVGSLVYVAVVVVGVRWAVVRGRRLATAATILASTVAVPVLAGSVARSADHGGVTVLGGLAVAALLMAAGAVVGVVAGAVHPRTAGRIVAVAAAGLVVVTAVGGLRAGQVADDERTARYEEVGAPLALVGGSDLSVPADDWEIVSIGQGWSSDEVTVTFAAPAPAGSSDEDWVRLVMARHPEPPRCGRAAAGDDACAHLGRRDDGAEILGDPITGHDPVTGYGEVWVDVAGGRWSIRGTDVPQPVDATAAVAILTALEPVDATTFTAAT